MQFQSPDCKFFFLSVVGFFFCKQKKQPTNKNAKVQGTPKFIAIKCMFTTKSMKYFTVDME